MARELAPETTDLLLNKIPFTSLSKILEPAMEKAAEGLYDTLSEYHITYEQFMSIVFTKMAHDLTRNPKDFLDWIQQTTSEIGGLNVATLVATLGDCVQQTVHELDQGKWSVVDGQLKYIDEVIDP